MNGEQAPEVMERGHDSDHGKGQGGQRLGRTWSERISGPFLYRRFTDTGVGRDGPMNCIFFKVEVPSGDKEIESAVYQVFNEAKRLPRLSRGRSGDRHMGLTFSREPQHGRVWRLPNTPEGRVAADVIQSRLDDLAHELQHDQGPRR